MDRIFGLLIGLLILSVMLCLHEIGHYLTGKKLGFKIEEFNIFMGPILFSRTKNGVKFSLRAIPLGASVQFAGEGSEEEESQEPGLFNNRPKRYRAAVLASGPLVNIFSGFLALLLMFSLSGYVLPVISEVSPNGQAAAAGLQPGDRIIRIADSRVSTSLDLNFVSSFAKDGEIMTVEYIDQSGAKRQAQLIPQKMGKYMLGIGYEAGSQLRITTVDPSSNQGKPVLQPGDIILKVNGAAADSESLLAALQKSQGEALRLEVKRGEQRLELETLPTLRDSYNSRGIAYRYEKTFLGAVAYSYHFCGSILRVTVSSIGKLVAGVIAPQDALSGPIGIVDMVSGVVAAPQVNWTDKVYDLLLLFALISISLGTLNLLPIPLLDGSHLLLLILEAIRGKRLGKKAQTVIAVIGLSIIIGLFALGIYFDIRRIVLR